jgi:CBS domain-containing protein
MSTAAYIMTRNVVTVSESMTLREYIRLIQEKAFTGCPVIGLDGLAVGFISQADVLRGLAGLLSSGNLAADSAQKRQLSIRLLLEGKPVVDASLLDRFLSMPVSEVMSQGVYSCHLSTPIIEVCETLSRLRIHRMVVVDEFSKVAGIISSLDALKHCSRELKANDRDAPILRNLTPINEPQEQEESD